MVTILPRPLLVIVEGLNDLEFLTRLSQRLHAEDPAVVDLAHHQAHGRLILVPTGGGDFVAWATRFVALDCPEFHLCDRELPADEIIRRRAMELVNSRPLCRGFVTSKRALENYLHPQAIAAAGGGTIEFGDDECVGSLLAERWYRAVPQPIGWSQLNRRARQRLVQRAKRWLNRQAIQQMTPDLLARRDPSGEVRHWLAVIAELLQHTLSGASTHE